MALDGGADGLDFYRAVDSGVEIRSAAWGEAWLFEVGYDQAPAGGVHYGRARLRAHPDLPGHPAAIWRVVEGDTERIGRTDWTDAMRDGWRGKLYVSALTLDNKIGKG